ncbi:MAG: GMC family oxidoreductase [Candidatus Acidiferrales bacterium]
MSEKMYEAVVIGSGFGGAINACRLARKWPGGQVLVLERGKRYPMGSFPRSPHDFARNFWSLSSDSMRRPAHIRKTAGNDDLHGMFDVRNYGHMDVVMSAGFGGGSLIYANVFMPPPDWVFNDRWPSTCKKPNLLPYYEIARDVLGSRPVPVTHDPRRRLRKTELFQKAAASAGKKSELVDINVFFGNDFANPLTIGTQEKNRFGALQTSCTYCGECIVGCNYHAKNTTDLNYLFVAEHRFNAEVRTEHVVTKIVPLGKSGAEDTDADGANGYRVHFLDLTQGAPVAGAVVTQRVIVSAGTLGTTELLLRAKLHSKTLPRISNKLGQSFSGNGDFLEFVLGSREPADPNYGPTITQRTDYNLFAEFDPNHAFILEDASYPTQLAWFVEGAKPGFLWLGPLIRTARAIIARIQRSKSLGSIGFALADVLMSDVSYHTAVLLCMGLDRSNGVMSLDENHNLTIDWPFRDSMPLYKAIENAGEGFRKAVGADVFAALPTWDWPLRKNITVHPLGGCTLANDSNQGVTSADIATFGQVFEYKGLYVADGSLLPTAAGANPVATISALSERVAEGITKIPADPDLGA